MAKLTKQGVRDLGGNQTLGKRRKNFCPHSITKDVRLGTYWVITTYQVVCQLCGKPLYTFQDLF